MDTLSLEESRKQSARLAEHITAAASDAFDEGIKEFSNPTKKLLFSIQAHAKRLGDIANSQEGTSEEIEHERSVLDTRAIELEMAMIKADMAPSAQRSLKKLIAIARTSDSRSRDSHKSERGPMSASEISRWQVLFKEHSAAITKLSQDIRDVESKQTQAHRRVLDTSKLALKSEVEIKGKAEHLERATKQAIASGAEIIAGLQKKEQEVNTLVGLISGTAVAGSYERSAQSEMKWADGTRNGSVLLMLLIVMIIGYSLLETGTPHFEWQTSLFRLFFSVALSVPAAYLARESTKHRVQQYSYRRMSLDLQAITPYLASLPDGEQHRLKAEMASRLFGGRETDHIKSESYPLNIQELVMALVSKVGEPQNAADVRKDT